MELKKEWFEPGPDGKSRFTKLYRKSMDSGLLVSEAISAAFRALLAEGAAQEPPALQVGDVVRLEAYNNNSMPSWVGREATIVETRRKNCIGYVTVKTDGIDCDFGWETAALTLVRRAVEAAPGDKHADEIHRLQSELHARNDEITGLRAEVERLKSECSDQQRYVLDLESAIASKETRIKVLEVANDSLTQYSSNLTAKRDALQARIDAGVRVYSLDCKDWHTERCLSDNHSATLIIDQPDAAMVDERTGKADRRENPPTIFFSRMDGTMSTWRSLCRRKNPTGTRADRGVMSESCTCLLSMTATSATIHNADPNCPVHGQGAK